MRRGERRSRHAHDTGRNRARRRARRRRGGGCRPRPSAQERLLFLGSVREATRRAGHAVARAQFRQPVPRRRHARRSRRAAAAAAPSGSSWLGPLWAEPRLSSRPRRATLAGVAALSAPRQYGGLDALPSVRRLEIPALFLVGRQDTSFARDARRLHRATTSHDKALVVTSGSEHGTDLLAGPRSRARSPRLSRPRLDPPGPAALSRPRAPSRARRCRASTSRASPRWRAPPSRGPGRRSGRSAPSG